VRAGRREAGVAEVRARAAAHGTIADAVILVGD
jgi:hypothetical protein